MDFNQFKLSVNEIEPPTEANILLKALWYDAKGNWEAAHNIAQMQEGTFSYDRIHAYLHRKEGDIFNAKWWYNRIKVKFPEVSLIDEWKNLVNENL